MGQLTAYSAGEKLPRPIAGQGAAQERGTRKGEGTEKRMKRGRREGKRKV